MQIDPRFGQLMRQLRHQQGTSLRSLSQVIHFHHAYLWDIETSRKAPSRRLAEAVDAALAANGRLLALAVGPAIAPMTAPGPHAVSPPPRSSQNLPTQIDPGEWLVAHAESLTNASQWAQLATWLYDKFVRERPRLMRLAGPRYSRNARETTGSTPFRIEAARQGRAPRVECRSVTRIPAEPAIARRLAIADGDLVVRRENWYYADDEPMQLGMTYLPTAVASNSPLAGAGPLGAGGLYGRLAEIGHHLSRVREQVFVRMPSAQEATALKLSADAPVIELVHVGYDSSGTPFELTCFILRADLMGAVYDLPMTD